MFGAGMAGPEVQLTIRWSPTLIRIGFLRSWRLDDLVKSYMEGPPTFNSIVGRLSGGSEGKNLRIIYTVE